MTSLPSQEDSASGEAHAGERERREGAGDGAAGRDAGGVRPRGEQQEPGAHLQLPPLLPEPAGEVHLQPGRYGENKQTRTHTPAHSGTEGK